MFCIRRDRLNIRGILKSKKPNRNKYEKPYKDNTPHTL